MVVVEEVTLVDEPVKEMVDEVLALREMPLELVSKEVIVEFPAGVVCCAGRKKMATPAIAIPKRPAVAKAPLTIALVKALSNATEVPEKPLELSFHLNASGRVLGSFGIPVAFCPTRALTRRQL